MNKSEFLAALRAALDGLRESDVQASLEYYGELIDDAMEDGMNEAEAVASVGAPGEIAAQIRAGMPPASEPIRPNPRRAWRVWEIVLLILGAPLWLPLLISAGAVVLAVLIVAASIVITLCALFVLPAALVLAGLAAAAMFLVQGSAVHALLFLGAGLFCAGCAILLYFVCAAAVRLFVRLMRLICRGVRRCFVGRTV